MKKLFILILLSGFLASCSTGGNSSDKKAELETLKKQQAELKEKIITLENELAESDSLSDFRFKNVGVTEMKNSPFHHYIEVQAKVEGDEDVLISAESMGTVTAVNVKAGDKVSIGQILAQTDDRIIRQGIAELQSQVDLITQLFNKQKNLWDQKIGSEVQFLQAKANKESMDKKMAGLQQQWDLTKIKSPINGTVDQVNIKVGETVAPGLPAFRVVNLNSLKVVAEVAESFISKVNKGNDVIIYFPDQNKEIRSKLNYSGQAINELNRTFNVEVRLNSKDGSFNPNMVAVLKIVDYTSPNAFTVPIGSIQKSSDGEFVYVATQDGDKTFARRKKVSSGMTYNGITEITSGLDSGDKVITFGYQNIIDGDMIRL
ncbi:MAG: efflux RND transporter periplasmic adaptor subunit [Bacteroidetes bacterium]|nr:MAG: efflux RND transporter periplasmic adaptor subunit [Bacteroidota bacterium]